MRAALAIVALVSALGGPTLAETPDEARAVDLERGVALFRAGDFGGAIPPLERAHRADPSDLDTALLLGITYHRAGRAADARPLLEAAAGSSDAEVASSARLFLGLLAEREGRVDEARARFAEVAGSGVADLAAAARRLTARDAPLSLYALVRTEVDSNVPLVPSASSAETAAAASDLDILGVLSVEGCLGDAHRACLGGLLLGRKQAQLGEHDLFAASASLRYRHDRPALRLTLGYGFEPSWRGGEALGRAHVVDAALRRRLAGGWWLWLAGRFAHRDWLPADLAPLGGPVVDGTLGARWRSGRLELGAAATPLREWTDDPALAATGAGGRFDGRLPVGPLEVELAASVMQRWFDEGRRDLELRAEAALVWPVTAEIGLLLGGTALARDDLEKLTAYLGVDVALSGP